MPKRTLGYVELTWECPNCQTKNKGLEKTCTQCGGPQPADLEFGLEENAALITKQEELEAARLGSNVHCPYCGTRNPQNATTCAQCGGDLVSGVKRAAGKVLAPKTCPKCATVNPNAAKVCKKCGEKLQDAGTPTIPPPPTPPAGNGSSFRPWMLLPIVAGLMLLCSLIWLLFFRSTDVMGVVSSTHWTRSIKVESLREVRKQAWMDQIPADGKVLQCSQEYREDSSSPTINSKEVCATKIVDQGNGAAEIVEECIYQVYDDYCSYTSMEWAVVDEVVAQGFDLNPQWPTYTLGADQREGAGVEQFEVVFNTSDGPMTYTTTDLNAFQTFTVGSEWMLSINTLGAIVDITR